MKSWEFVHSWQMPLVWAVLSTAVTVPVAVYFQRGMETEAAGGLGLAYGTAWVLRDDFLASIVVYALSLASAVWLFDADGSTRWAAFWATLYAIARLAVPISLATMSDVQVGVDRHYIDWGILRVVIWFQDGQMFLLSLMLWGAFARFVASGGPVPSASMHFAEA